MQKVAWRRKQQPKQRHPNSIQLPFFVPDDLPEKMASKKHAQVSNESDAICKSGCAKTKILDPKTVESEAFYLNSSLTQLRVCTTDQSLIFIKCNLSFLKLSLLASKDVGRYTGQRLLESPEILPLFLGEGNQGSYCHYIPFHYDRSDLVRNATDSVVARARCLLSPENPEWESLAISSYLKAVSDLQEAINSPSHFAAEVLLAIQILGLYEVSSHI